MPLPIELDPSQQIVWQSDFGDLTWFSDRWNNEASPKKGIAFGKENIEIVEDGSRAEGHFLRVHFPEGSWSPQAMKNAGLPCGGTQFYGAVFSQPVDQAVFSYCIRFPSEFNWVKGGKLPGLYGGEGNTGSKHPDGTDGFTTRYMWRENGRGILYPFLPTTEDNFGTTIQLGDRLFTADNEWHTITQEVVLNTIDSRDGQIRVWYDDQLVSETTDLEFRTIADLQINGVVFQTFFGGSTADWKTPISTYADFANFQVSTSHSEPSESSEPSLEGS